MPIFQHSVAVLPLPFRSAVLPFRSYRCRCGWERKCWKRLSLYIGTKWPERWLVARLQQNGKNRIRSYLLWNGSYGRWKRQRHNRIFLHRQRNSYGAYGICVTATATECWKLGINTLSWSFPQWVSWAAVC